MPPTGAVLKQLLNASTPLGSLGIGLNQNSTFDYSHISPEGVVRTAYQLTGGSLDVPMPLQLLLAAAGPNITGGYSLFNSGNAVYSALSSGNPVGAAVALFSAPFNYADAVLFGHQNVPISIPLGSPGGGTGSIDLNIPFGGVFASPAPATVDVAHTTIYDSNGFLVSEYLPSHVAFGGTQFGGIASETLRAFGIDLSAFGIPL